MDQQDYRTIQTKIGRSETEEKVSDEPAGKEIGLRAEIGKEEQGHKRKNKSAKRRIRIEKEKQGQKERTGIETKQ